MGSRGPGRHSVVGRTGGVAADATAAVSGKAGTSSLTMKYIMMVQIQVSRKIQGRRSSNSDRA